MCDLHIPKPNDQLTTHNSVLTSSVKMVTNIHASVKIACSDAIIIPSLQKSYAKK